MFPASGRCSLQWYAKRIEDKIKIVAGPSAAAFKSGASRPDPSLVRGAFLKTATYLREHPQSTIDGIIGALEASEGPFAASSSDEQATSMKGNLVFLFIGWLTMLYRPSIEALKVPVFRISQDVLGDADPYLVHTQPHSAGKRKMPSFLKGFGRLLPTRKIDVQTYHSKQNENSSEPVAPSTISPVDVNAALLVSFGKLRVAWTDMLPAHLQLDDKTGCLYIFECPSYCLSSIPGDEPGQVSESPRKSILQGQVPH
jgi:hypothetical protein